MVHSGYHPLKHCPLLSAWMVVLRLVLGWHSGYHPLKHCPLRLVLGWCTVGIILINLVLLG